MKNIVMTGSPNWQDRTKIKDVIFDLKSRLNEELHIIAGGGKLGADLYIRKTTLDFDIEYSEIPPYNAKWNQYCLEPPYKYDKQFSPKHIFMRNELLAKKGDLLIVFLDSSDVERLPIEDLVSRYQKRGKKVLIIQ